MAKPARMETSGEAAKRWNSRDLEAPHRVVQLYLTTDTPILDILRQVSPDDAVTQALLALYECLSGKRLAKQAIELAQAVPLEESDPHLLVLMLCAWAELSSRIGRHSDAGALVHRARALLSNRSPPEIRCLVLSGEAALLDRTGNKVEAERLFRQVLGALPVSSPRRKTHALDLAWHLALQGRLRDMPDGKDGQTAGASASGPDEPGLLPRFIDAVETSHLSEARNFLDSLIRHRLSDVTGLPASMLSAYHALLGFLAEMSTSAHPLSVPPLLRAVPPPWIEVLRSLSRHQPAMALRLARDQAKRALDALFGSGFPAFNLVRAELASGNADAARRLLALRQERGNVHYLDPLFLARVERLAGNHRLAARHFSEALDAVDRYDAQGRLDVELRLACELSYQDVIALTRAARDTAVGITVRTVGPDPRTGERDTGETFGIDRIIGRSPAIQAIRDMILRMAEADAPVLITGETGTGKELVARALHAASPRRAAPFVAVNCGSLAESLLESELFGHARGAYTGADRPAPGLFEEAGEGVILLDEMAGILPRLQQALLRVLETGEIRAVGSSTTKRIRCRILAATNADLSRLAEEGRFRKDLLYRLQRLMIDIPPLRERHDDILPLAYHFLDLGRPPGVHATLAKDLAEWLESYDWPGNVRELKNLIERMRLMHSDKLSYRLEDLDFKLRTASVGGAPTRIPIPPRRGTARLPLPPHPLVPESRKDRAVLSPLTPPGPASIASSEGADTAAARRATRHPMRRLEWIRDLFRTHQKLTRAEIMAITGVSANTATHDLKLLCTEGFIVRVEPSASTRSHYFELRCLPGSRIPPQAQPWTEGVPGGLSPGNGMGG